VTPWSSVVVFSEGRTNTAKEYDNRCLQLSAGEHERMTFGHEIDSAKKIRLDLRSDDIRQLNNRSPFHRMKQPSGTFVT
jgi:hypothetical protein